MLACRGASDRIQLPGMQWACRSDEPTGQLFPTALAGSLEVHAHCSHICKSEKEMEQNAHILQAGSLGNPDVETSGCHLFGSRHAPCGRHGFRALSPISRNALWFTPTIPALMYKDALAPIQSQSHGGGGGRASQAHLGFAL